jgi:hypothetical protein
VLILNKLLIFIDAQNRRNAGNAVSTHVLHTHGISDENRSRARSFFDLGQTANRLAEGIGDLPTSEDVAAAGF